MRPLLAAILVLGLLAAPPVSASDELSLRDARKAAVKTVKRLERKLRDTGAKSSAVPVCWRKSKHAVGCLGIVRGADELVRWRCAVPMTVRRPATATASSRKLAVEFVDTMCSF